MAGSGSVWGRLRYGAGRGSDEHFTRREAAADDCPSDAGAHTNADFGRSNQLGRHPHRSAHSKKPWTN